MKRLALLSVLALSACVSAPRVEKDGLDGYRVVVSGRAGEAPSRAMQDAAHEEAGRYCAAKSLLVQTVNYEGRPASQAGGKPEGILKFRCVGKPERLK